MKTLLNTKHTTIIEVEGKEMIERPVASAVLAFDANHDVVIVKQNRGVFGKILEVPAGKVDEGEDPIDAGARELLEETGYKADKIEHLISYYPSVGYSTERIDCFLAYCGRLPVEQRLDDNEKVTVGLIKLDKLEEMIDSGEILDSKTIMCVRAYRRKKQLEIRKKWKDNGL